MLIVDALNIRKGGGAVLLSYLAEELQKKEIKFKLLINDAFIITNQINENQVFRFKMDNYFGRSKILKKFLTPEIDTLLCFGNFPPPFKTNATKTFVFFQNYILLNDYKFSTESLLNRLSLIFKRRYLKFYLKNANYLIFQTTNIRANFLKSYKFKFENCLVLPFYDENKILEIKRLCIEENKTVSRHNFIYVSNPSFHKNFDKLFDAWEVLLSKNFKPTLFLTIPKIDNSLINGCLQKIQQLNSIGCKIINLGNLPLEQVLVNTYECYCTVYPSLSESFGLGLIESYHMGLKILASDLPYVNAVIKPSLVFDPYSSESIANAVEKAMHEILPKPEILVKNQIDELIKILTN